ncbi:MAG: RpiB/LacA/LacB family sugar-phosphate isomerase, partial [Rickettsiaceae bacterium]|nr:RpiB/LacA/LacB family sugar-phosphate isomerase [Rickettsiaceae bacterium]
MNNYNISIASDHAGFPLKQKIISYLEAASHNTQDLGTNNEFEKVDYPDYAAKLCENMLDQSSDFGILICRSGIGMSIAANRFSGIRAA